MGRACRIALTLLLLPWGATKVAARPGPLTGGPTERIPDANSPDWLPWMAPDATVAFNGGPGVNPDVMPPFSTAINSLCVDTQGVTHVLMGGSYLNNRLETRRSNGFSVPEVVANSPDSSMAVGADGVVHVVWAESNGPLKYRKQTSAGWQTPVVISPTSSLIPGEDPRNWQAYSHCKICISPTGGIRIYVQCQEGGNGLLPVYYLLTSVNGGPLSLIPNMMYPPPNRIGNWTDTLGTYGFDNSGNPILVWHHTDPIAAIDDNYYSLGFGAPAFFGHSNMSSLSVACDSQGNIHQAWFDTGTRHLQYRSNFGSPIQTIPSPDNPTVPAGATDGLSIVVDSRDQIHVIWMNPALCLASRLKNPDPGVVNPNFQSHNASMPVTGSRRFLSGNGTDILSPEYPNGYWWGPSGLLSDIISPFSAQITKDDQIYVTTPYLFTKTVEKGVGVRDPESRIGVFPGGSADLSSGNLHIEIPLFQAKGVGKATGLTLSYNSLDSSPGMISRGWKLNCEMLLIDHWRAVNIYYNYIFGNPQPIEWVTVLMPDGRHIPFRYYPFFDPFGTPPEPGPYYLMPEPGYGVNARLSRWPNAPNPLMPNYALTMDDGSTYTFNGSGKLWRMYSADNNYLELFYDAGGRLLEIQDMLGGGGTGRRTTFQYETQTDPRVPPRPTQITDPGGSVYTLNYQGQDLSSVVFTSAPGMPAYTFTYGSRNDPASRQRYDVLATFATPRATSGGYSWSCFYLPDGRIQEVDEPRENIVAEGAGSQALPAVAKTTLTYTETLSPTQPRETWVTDRRGFNTKYKIDPTQGMVVEVDDPAYLADPTAIYPVVRTLDKYGNVTLLQNRWGKTTQYDYDANPFPAHCRGNLKRILRQNTAGTALGVVASFNYSRDNNNRLSDATTYVTAPYGTGAVARTTSYQYNSLGQLTNLYLPSVTRPDGTTQTGVTRTYTYGGPRSALSQITNEEGHTTTFSNFSPLTSLPQAVQRQGDTQFTTMQYDAMGNPTHVLLPQGGVGNETPLATIYGLDALYRVHTITDPAGKITTYDYDLDSRLVTVTPPSGGGSLSSISYDRRGFLAGGSGPDGSWSQFVDAEGNVRQRSDLRGYQTTMLYDDRDRVTEIDAPGASTVGSGGGGAPGKHITQFAYDLLDRGTQTYSDQTTQIGGTLPNRVTTTQYDARRRPKVFIAPDTLTQRQTFYNELDLIVATQTIYNGACQTCSVYFRDDRDRVDHVRTQDVSYPTTPGPNQINTYTIFNKVGAVAKTVDPLGVVKTLSANANKIGYTYDTQERLQTVVDGKGVTVSSFTYGDDDLLTLAQVPDPVAKTSTLVTSYTRTYTSRKELKTEKNAAGFGMAYSYATNPGQIDTTTDALNHQTHRTYYSDTQRPQDFIEASNAAPANQRKTSYSWNYGLLNQTTVFDPTPNANPAIAVYGYDYDQAGRLERFRYPSVPQTALANEQYLYNEFGESSKLIAGTKTMAHTYNSLGQATSTAWTGSVSASLSRTFNGIGQMKSVTDATSRENDMAYDVWRGTPRTEDFKKINTTQKTQTHTYDLAGNYTGFADPEGGAHAWVVDENNRVKQIQYATKDVCAITYTPGGLVNTITLKNSAGTAIAVTTVTYDGVGRKVEEKTVKSGSSTVLGDIAWEYNNDNLVTKISYKHLSPIVQSVPAYNERHEVIGETVTGGATYTATYVLDQAGNRKSQTINGATTTFTYNGASQLISEAWPTSVVTHRYDAWGNDVLRTNTPSGGAATTETYQYNYLNRLSAYTNSATGASWQYAYWPNGDRYSKTNSASGAATLFCARNGDVVTEYDQTGAFQSRYVQGARLGEKTTRITSTGTRTHYLGDAVGTLVVTLNDAAAVQATSVKDIWGKQITGGTSPEHYGLAQCETDSESGFVYMRHRMYDPRTGRFTQTDPILGNRPGKHYSYGDNNPISNTDPTGEYAVVTAQAELDRIKSRFGEQNLKITPTSGDNLAGLTGWQVEVVNAEAARKQFGSKWETGNIPEGPWAEYANKFIAYSQSTDAIWQVEGVSFSSKWSSSAQAAPAAQPHVIYKGNQTIVQGADTAPIWPSSNGTQKGRVLHWEPMLENPFGVPFWFAYTAQFLPVPEAGLVDLPAIKATQRGLTHVLERHFPGGARSAGKSLFNAGEDLAKLLKTAESVAPVKQIRGNFQRVVNVGRTIGVDRATGQATSVYTVITNEAGELVTTFPGRPN